jgi:hypothetical protein
MAVRVKYSVNSDKYQNGKRVRNLSTKSTNPQDAGACCDLIEI